MKYPKSRELIKKVLEKEMEKTGVKVDVMPTTTNENAFEIIKDGIMLELETTIDLIKETIVIEFKNTKEIIKYIRAKLVPNKMIAYYSEDEEKIRVLIDSIKKGIKDSDLYLLELLKTTYHEYKHVLIKSNKKTQINNLADFYLTTEKIFMNSANPQLWRYYEKNHDSFYEEILADKYGIEKTEEYVISNMNKSKKSKRLMPWIRLLKMQHQLEYQNYDIQPSLNQINKIMQTKSGKKDLFNSTFGYIIQTLFDEEGNYKDLNNLYQDDNWNLLPDEVKYSIISNEGYLSSLDYNNLNKDNIEFILNSINYIYNLTQIKQEKNKLLRKELEKISRNLQENDLYSVDIYLEILLILNEKEAMNKQKLSHLKSERTKFLALLKINSKPLQKKRIFIDAD